MRMNISRIDIGYIFVQQSTKYSTPYIRAAVRGLVAHLWQGLLVQ